ncbi:hypothetical protein Q1695_005991 [Nippostrongylus brasiliensis]|nr:hypothetical protein Q1695_005991 [Nippostrongylus brasiliensis]
MPPKKSVVTSDTPTWLKPSLERWNDYFLRLDKLFDVFLSIQKAQMAILDRISCIEFNLEAADHGSSTQQHSAHYTALVKFKKDSKIVDDKASRITWVGVGEKASEEATRAFDVEAIKEVVTASGDSELVDEFDAGRIQCHRFPKVKDSINRRRPRIIKIACRSPEIRDKLLQHMRGDR